jgi:hypothetical protein
MSSKQSPTNTNLKTIELFKKLLISKSVSLFNDENLRRDLLKIKDLLLKLESKEWQVRSEVSSKRLAKMSEEERRMSLMRPAEKLFFLEYKAKNPENPWGYVKAWQKKLQAEYKNAHGPIKHSRQATSLSVAQSKYKQGKVQLKKDQTKSSVKLKTSLSS